MSREIISYYESYDEGSRLERDNFHRIEFLTTMRYLEKTIPAHSSILDACAGAGAYSFALAQLGHSVTACDLVPKHIIENITIDLIIFFLYLKFICDAMLNKFLTIVIITEEKSETI